MRPRLRDCLPIAHCAPAASLLAAAWIACVPTGFAVDRLPAVETFRQLQAALINDKQRADWQDFLADSQRQMAFLNGAPTSRLEVARAELQLGRADVALAELRSFVAMGQTNDILSTPLFRPLKAAIEPQLASNLSTVALGKGALPLEAPDLLPEDIDYDQVTKRFFVTSVLKHIIVTLDSEGHQALFAQAPDHWPVVAIKVDSKRRRVWATEVAFQGFAAISQTDWGRSAVLEFDIDRGTLLSRHEGPPHSDLGDMALAKNGDPIVSDGDGGGVYRVRDNVLARLDHGEFISPQTVAICPDGRHAFVPDYVRGIAAFDMETGAVRWLATKARFALDGIDGLYCHDGALIAVQNGTSPVRVIVFHLDRLMAEITDERVIERSTQTLGVPTHGVFVGPAFFYIANSGWDGLDEHGTRKPSAPHSVPVIMRVDNSTLLNPLDGTSLPRSCSNTMITSLANLR